MSESTWEKSLWKRSLYPDNYVPPSFLAALRKNGMSSKAIWIRSDSSSSSSSSSTSSANIVPYDYWSAALHTCVVAQQLSAVSIFSSIFVLLLNQRLDPRLLVLVTLLAFILGFAYLETLLPRRGATSVKGLSKITLLYNAKLFNLDCQEIKRWNRLYWFFLFWSLYLPFWGLWRHQHLPTLCGLWRVFCCPWTPCYPTIVLKIGPVGQHGKIHFLL